jgi:hypothetical protein
MGVYIFQRSFFCSIVFYLSPPILGPFLLLDNLKSSECFIDDKKVLIRQTVRKQAGDFVMLHCIFVRFDFIISSSGRMLAGEMQGDEESRYGAVLF